MTGRIYLTRICISLFIHNYKSNYVNHVPTVLNGANIHRSKYLILDTYIRKSEWTKFWLSLSAIFK